MLVLAGIVASGGCGAGGARVIDAGFSFDRVTFASALLGGALTPSQLVAVEAEARAELDRAFSGLRIRVSDRRDARYHVMVLQQIRDGRSRSSMFVAGESRAIRGIGGRGAVNFSLLASAALSCAPQDAPLEVLLEAIGRGVGRAAAHEFAHQFLPTTPIHASRDRGSYEYYAAGRCQQYFGPMHWDLAGPLLRERFGSDRGPSAPDVASAQ